MLGRWAGRLVTGPLAFLVSGLIDAAVLGVYLHRHRSHRARATRSRRTGSIS